MTTPISVLNAIEANWTTGTDDRDEILAMSAAQCALFNCFNRYNANVIKGLLYETIISSWHDNSATYLQADGTSGKWEQSTSL
jgi:hypothetical protein